VRAVIITIAAACQQSLPSPEPGPIPTTPPPPLVIHTPFVIANQIVAEDGTVARTLDGVLPGYAAIPDGPHRFKVGNLLVDTAADTVTKVIEPVALNSVAMFGRHDHDDYELVRSEPDGRVRWKTPVSGVRTVRPPDIAVGGGRVVVTIGSEVAAFDDATGKRVWTLDGDGDRLHVAGDTLISVRYNEPTHDHWLTATALADGKQRFRVALDDGCDPYVAVYNDRIIVVEDRNPPVSRIYNLDGTLIAKLAAEIEGSHRDPWGASHLIDDKLVLVTDKHVMELDAAGKVLWRRETLRDTFVAADQVVALPGGDLVIANYGAISDSGVDVVRLHGDGALVWRSCARALGVPHSEYSHLAYVEARGDELFVISQGASGAFLERLSLTTGARELRCVMGAACSHLLPPPAGEAANECPAN
jgi:outer membrane protein assembly factor BamB